MIPPILNTERLNLRQHIEDDLDQLRDILRDPDVMKYSGLDVNDYLKNANAELEWFKQLDKSDNGIRWIIVFKDKKMYLGDLGFLDIDIVNNKAEISYKLSSKQWNKGIITEALRAVLSYGFNELGLNKITAQVHHCNGASHSVLRKLGFIMEGTLRKHEYIYGKFVDVRLFGLLKKDYLHHPKPF